MEKEEAEGLFKMKKIILMIMIGILLFLPLISASLWDNILGYYKFDEGAGTLVNNSVNSLYNMQTVNNPTWVIGLLGNASQVKSTSNQYIINSTADFGLSNNFTFNFWINYTSGTNILMYKNASICGIEFDGGAVFNLWSGNCDGGYYTDIETSIESGWQMITIRGNRTGTQLYKNGGYIGNILNTTMPAKAELVLSKDRGGSSGYINGMYDEFGIWNRSLSVSEITELYNDGYGLDYGTEEVGGVIHLISPIDNSVVSSSTAFLTAYFNITGTERNWTWRNATFYTWKSGAVYNQSFVLLSANNTQNSTNVTNLVLGSYKWNAYGCYANNSFSNCTWASNNFSFEVGAITIAEYYNAGTYETSSENFQINISILNGTSLISAFLWYNGTSYSVSDISVIGSQKVLKKTIDIPVNPYLYQNTSRSFHWAFTFSNALLSPQNTTVRQQNVSFINFQLCNATYSTTAINFTIKDEKNPNPRINASFHSTWDYWIGNGNIKMNYSFEDTTITNSSFKFCVFPQDKIYNTDANIEYSSTGFPERTRYLQGAILSNITQELDLFLINETEAVKFFFTLTQSLTPVADAIVIISKYDVGVGNWITVGIRKSDTSGKFIEYLELDKEYQFSITKNSLFLGTIYKNSVCNTAPCEVSLELTSATTDLWSGYYDIYATNVAYNLTYNPTTKNITFTFVDLTGLAQYFRLQVNQINYNQTGAVICNKTSYTTAGNIICDISAYTGNFRANAFISRSPEKLVDTLFAIIAALRDVIGREGLFFTLIVVVTVGLIGAWNPVVGIILAATAMFFSAVIGFISITYTTIIIIFVLAIFMIIKMGRWGGI